MDEHALGTGRRQLWIRDRNDQRRALIRWLLRGIYVSSIENAVNATNGLEVENTRLPRWFFVQFAL